MPVCSKCMGPDLTKPCPSVMKAPYYVPAKEVVVEEHELEDGCFICEDKVLQRIIDNYVNGEKPENMKQDTWDRFRAMYKKELDAGLYVPVKPNYFRFKAFPYFDYFKRFIRPA